MEHSALTGSNLHESKGVAAATANTVYVADGVGSGAWSTLGNASLASAAKAFQAQLLHVRDQVSSGTAGQTLTAATWNKRTLQTTVTNEITSATLSSSVISLPAGTYMAEITAIWHTAFNAERSQLKLRDTTSGTDLLIGQSNFLTFSGSITWACNTTITLKGRFTIAGTKNIELQHWVANANNTAGSAASSGVGEVYTDVMIWKVA